MDREATPMTETATVLAPSPAAPTPTRGRAAPSEARIEQLNAEYAPLDFKQRLHRLYEDFSPSRVLVTSSFAATSAYFLHII
ncbi:MAG: hypothetical protein ACX94A_12865, partial [Algiphilus sp.]